MCRTFLLLAISSLLLTSCGVAECIDGAIPRSTSAVGSHRAEIRYGEQAPFAISFSCERYYDAQCSERGNSWRTRQSGTTDEPTMASYLTVQDPDLGRIEIPRPRCIDTVNLHPADFGFVQVNSVPYRLVSYQGTSFQYKRAALNIPGRPDHPGPEVVEISYRFYWNSKETRPHG